MVPPRREKKPQPHNDPVEPSPYDGPENAKEAQKPNSPASKSRSQTKEEQTRGKDEIGRDMATEGSRTRGRDQTAREMAEQRHQK
jgi:hypothetical protein